MTQPKQIPLANLVVFGDSLSDIGIMNKTFLGGFAKAIGQMTTNETGRYSDGRNWTDYIYQWVGTENLVGLDVETTKKKSTVFQSLTENSKIPFSNSVEKGPLVYYANYAKGGAVAASDKLAKGGTLSYLTAQCDQYLAQRKKLGTKFTGATLHVIWIGLNDIVTAERADTEGPEVVYDKAPMGGEEPRRAVEEVSGRRGNSPAGRAQPRVRDRQGTGGNTQGTGRAPDDLGGRLAV